MVIDLTKNSGGFVSSVEKVTDKFLSSGKMREQIPITKKEDVCVLRGSCYATDSSEDFKNIPLVLLVSKGTASSAEILIRALQKNHKGIVTIIGQKTFGKNVAQNLTKRIDNGYEFRHTIFHWTSAKGGIPPDITTHNRERSTEIAKRIAFTWIEKAPQVERGSFSANISFSGTDRKD